MTQVRTPARPWTADENSDRLRFAGGVALASVIPIGVLAALVIGSAPLAVLIAVGTAACIVLADLMI